MEIAWLRGYHCRCMVEAVLGENVRSRSGACICALAALAATFAFAAPTRAAFPGKNGKIAFVSARTGGPSDLDLFTMNP